MNTNEKENFIFVRVIMKKKNVTFVFAALTCYFFIKSKTALGLTMVRSSIE